MVAASAAVLFLGADPNALHAIGRNSSLTDRTFLWRQLLSLVQNPVFGTGFESFWLGPRLANIWQLNPALLPNESHNGYLEIYLNLGWVGVTLLLVFLALAYRSVLRGWRNNEALGSLGLAYFFIGLVYNFTEAAFFKMQSVVWLFFILGVVGTSAVLRQEDCTGRNELDPACADMSLPSANTFGRTYDVRNVGGISVERQVQSSRW